MHPWRSQRSRKAFLFQWRSTVRTTLTLLTVGSFIVCAGAGIGAQQPRTVAAPGTMTVDEALTSFRADLQTGRADVLAKNITLTSEQAAKFWPVYEQFQKEQNVIMDEQLRGIQTYAESADKLDDAGALALMKAHLERDAKMVALRQKWLAEFQKVLPAKLAVRAIQIDRRLSNLYQAEISSRIPLVR